MYDRRMILGSLPACALSLISSRVRADALAPPDVDVALALLVDVSGSIDHSRYELQMRGYAAAFLDADVISAMTSGPNRRVAISMLQWSSVWQQRLVLDWSIIDSAEAAQSVAAYLRYLPRQIANGSTAIAGALFLGVRMFERLPFRTLKKIIDISGDGKDNVGGAVADARDHAVAHGITVNGLPILASELDVGLFYDTQVVGGPGSFSILAGSFEDFGAAIRRKLVIELSSAGQARYG